MEDNDDSPQCRTTPCCAALLSLVLHKDPLTLSAERLPERTLLFKKKRKRLELLSMGLNETKYNPTLKRTNYLYCRLD